MVMSRVRFQKVVEGANLLTLLAFLHERAGEGRSALLLPIKMTRRMMFRGDYNNSNSCKDSICNKLD